MPTDRDRMQALYDTAPYPAVLEGRMEQTTPLLTHWINAVSPRRPLGTGARVLVAGCGSGAEAFMLRELFPEATIVGVDFSERSIALAQERAAGTGLVFEVADLMDAAWIAHHQPFDFVLCRGVADYVTDPERLMVHLGRCLAEGGVLCVMANSPHHPAGRIRRAFARLGVEPEEYRDTEDQRRLLATVEQLMGEATGLTGIAEAPAAYLGVDIFAPIAHHDPIETWARRAEAADLSFAGSLDAPLGLASLSDDQLGALRLLDRPALSLLMSDLVYRPGLTMLFGRGAQAEPTFTSLDALASWRPVLDPCVGQLPPLAGDPGDPKHLTLRFQGLADMVVFSTAYDLEVLRRCDGRSTLAEIRAAIPADCDPVSLLNALFRAYHYGILANA